MEDWISELLYYHYENISLEWVDLIYDINPNTILIISNTSIKNNVTTLILHICSSQNILAKTIYYVIKITSTEAELFSIRYGINQAIQVPNTKSIIVITDAIHTTRCIFNLSSHLYQLHSITISQNLRALFNKSSNNSIVFWDCPSSAEWLLHLAINKETK